MGHSSCLVRDFASRRGSEGYACEELAAEIAGAFLCASQPIKSTVRYADYISTWLAVLRNVPLPGVAAIGTGC